MKKKYNLWDILTVILLVVYSGVILTTFMDYGVTYDEQWSADYGDHILHFYTSGFKDTQALTDWDLIYKGGFSVLVMSIAALVSQLGKYETRHLVTAIFGFIGVVSAYGLGKTMAGSLAGFLSALILILTPRYYGDAFYNAMDIPQAALYALSLLLIILLIKNLETLSFKRVIITGIVIGLAVGIRVGAVLLLGFLAVAMGISYFSILRRNNLAQQNTKKHLLRLIIYFFCICGIAYVTMLLVWPAAMANPIKQPVRALREASHHAYTIDVLYEGKILRSDNLPWYYMLKWFTLVMPEVYFLGAIIGVWFIGRWLIGMYRQWRFEKRLTFTPLSIGIIILLMSIGVPLGFTILIIPVDFDAIRHFLFVVPPMAVLCGLSISYLLENTKIAWLRYGLIALLVVAFGLTIVDMARLHPDEYIYFNRIIAGGLAKAYGKYDIDYWGTSYKEAVQWLESNYPQQGDHAPYTVGSCLHSESVEYFLTDSRFQYIGSLHNGLRIKTSPDIFLAVDRWGCKSRYPGEVIHTVERMGVPLSYVIVVNK